MADMTNMSFGTFEANLSDAGLCDYLLQDLDDDPGALYNTVSASSSDHDSQRGHSREPPGRLERSSCGHAQSQPHFGASEVFCLPAMVVGSSMGRV